VSGDALVVEARSLERRFGEPGREVRAVRGVSLEVRRGELVVVVGRSGSGKSTLLHLLGGLDRADSGSVVVAGTALERVGDRGLTAVRREHVGFVFQAFHLLPELTGLENVLLPAHLAGDGLVAAPRVRALLAQLELAPLADQLPGSLSGGEQQRFAIARALVNEPSLVLADEPTGNLDAESAAIVLRLLRSIADDGRAVVLVTHDRDAAAIVADRVLLLRDGRLRP